MADLVYTRELCAVKDCPCDTYNVGYCGEKTSLADRIAAAMPSAKFVVRCAGARLTIGFSTALTLGDQTSVDNLVAAHKAANAALVGP